MQDFYNPIPMDLTMVRGDSLAFNFELVGADNVTEISFTCKENPADTEAIFTQTSGLDPARYYYDLELNAGADVITLMKGRLIVDWEVTY